VHSDEDDAELKCEHQTTLALAVDAGSVEALTCLANLRLCQQRPDEATAVAVRILDVLKAATAAGVRGEGLAGGWVGACTCACMCMHESVCRCEVCARV
jgi:hypothetical protein